MNVVQQFKLGMKLTKLTNEIERAEALRRTGRFLSEAEFASMEARVNTIVGQLSTYPRHVITREMLKNARLSQQMGNDLRCDTILKTIPFLIERGVALGLADFEASYS